MPLPDRFVGESGQSGSADQSGECTATGTAPGQHARPRTNEAHHLGRQILGSAAEAVLGERHGERIFRAAHSHRQPPQCVVRLCRFMVCLLGRMNLISRFRDRSNILPVPGKYAHRRFRGFGRKSGLRLQGFTMNTPESENKRVIRHEAGHTLGFPHEHMRKALHSTRRRRKTGGTGAPAAYRGRAQAVGGTQPVGAQPPASEETTEARSDGPQHAGSQPGRDLPRQQVSARPVRGGRRVARPAHYVPAAARPADRRPAR